MKELYLTDEEANRLIKMLKQFLKKYSIILDENSKGELCLTGIGGEKNGKFLLCYKSTKNNKVFQFMECKYNLTLFRINLNNSFHKNADGTRIHGNRINIFSAEEFYDKKDGHTHYKAFPLPFENISNTDDMFEMFNNIFSYANIIHSNDQISISIQDSLL